jgi:hypothetical protein
MPVIPRVKMTASAMTSSVRPALLLEKTFYHE